MKNQTCHAGECELDAEGSGEKCGDRRGGEMMKFTLEPGDSCGKKWEGFHDP